MNLNARRLLTNSKLIILVIVCLTIIILPQSHGAWTNPSVSVTPASKTAFPGSIVTFTVQVGGTSDSNDPIVLDDRVKYVPTDYWLPSDLTITFSPNNKPAPFTATMTVKVKPDAQYGAYKIWAVTSAYSATSNVVSLEVKPKIIQATTKTFPTPATTPGPTGPTFDFNLMLLPSSVTVEQGETANYQLQITYSDPSYSGTQISYQVIGLDPGLNWIPAGGGVIPISTSPTTPPGTYQVIVIGSAQGKTQQTSATLIVTESSQTTVNGDEESTSTIQSTSTTSVEIITVTEPRTNEEGSDLTSQLLNPIVLMVIVIAVLATALIMTLMRRRK